MKHIVSFHQGRSRLFFIRIVLVVLVGLLAACSGPGDEDQEATAVIESPTETVTTVVEVRETATIEPTEEIVAAPTDLPEVTPTAELTSILEMGSLPILDEVSFEILAQYGGIPSAIAVADDVAYVGFGPRLMTIDMSDPANPALIGTSTLLADNIHGIAVEDGFAYLAAGRSGLVVIDVADAENPVVVSAGPNYSGATQPAAQAIQLENGMAYLTDFNPTSSEVSLITFDVSEPTDIKFRESLPIQINDNLVIDQGRLVIVGNGRIEVRDTADLGRILGTSTLTSGDYSSQVVIRDDMAIVVETGGQAGMEFFDISSPADPAKLGDLVPIEIFLGGRVVASETVLFSLGTFGEFGYCDSYIELIDITSLSPVKISQLQPDSCVTDFVLDGDLLYTAGRNGVKIFDVSNPTAAVELGLFTSPDGFHSAEAVAVGDEVAYVLTGEGSGAELRIIDLSGETAVTYLESLKLESVVLTDLFIQNDTLIAPQWQGGLYLYDLTDGSIPVLASSAEDSSIMTGDLFSSFINGTTIYVPNVDGVQIGGIAAVDLSDPTDPQIAATVETGDYQVMHMAGGNGYLYVLTQGERYHIHIFDISDPLALEPVGAVLMPEPTNRIALYDETLFAVCDQWNCQSFYAIDVSEPDSAEIVGRWDFNIGAQDLTPAGDGLFYLSTYREGVYLLDVSNPAEPYISGHIQLPGDFTRIKMSDGVMYAVVYNGGLFIVSVEK